MNKKAKQEKIFIADIKSIMKSRDFDVDIQPIGTNKPEIVTGTSKNGTFEMRHDPTIGIRVTINGKEMLFDGQSENYVTMFNLKHECYEYREKYYHMDRNNKWVRIEKQPNFLTRIFRNWSK